MTLLSLSMPTLIRLRACLTTSDAEKLIHAFVFSRIDYGNIVFGGLPLHSIHKLQLIQNRAAWLLTQTQSLPTSPPSLLTSIGCLSLKFKMILLFYSPPMNLHAPYGQGKPKCFMHPGPCSGQWKTVPFPPTYHALGTPFRTISGLLGP